MLIKNEIKSLLLSVTLAENGEVSNYCIFAHNKKTTTRNSVIIFLFTYYVRTILSKYLCVAFNDLV